MAHWKENSRFLCVGRSGLQYQTTLSCSRPVEEVSGIVKQFYGERGAVLTRSPDGDALTFTRGRRWVSRFSSLLVVSERWPQQSIVVTLAQRAEVVVLDISYDVKMFFTFIIAPNALQKETRQLRTLLEAK
jgi:hypothetical protein